MKQRGMKILSLLLSFVLVLSLVPAAAAVSITEWDIIDLMHKMYDLADEKFKAGDSAAEDELINAVYALGDAYYYYAQGEVTDDVVAAYNSALAVYQKYTGVPVTTVPVTGVTLTPAATLTAGGDPVALTAAVSPADATDKKVKWNVGGDNPGALALYSDANCTAPLGTDATETLTVYAKGTAAGSATVTVTSNADATKYATCIVTVNAATVPVNDVTVDPTSATLTAGGDPVALTAAVSPADATDKTVKWSTTGGVTLYSDETCNTPVTLNTATDTLTVYAKGMSAGIAAVTVTSNADSTLLANCVVTVNAATVPVTGVTLDPSSATLTVGGIQKLTASVLPENATDKTVIWSVISGSDKVKLYSDETCQTEVTQDTATGTLTVFVKGVSAGGATVEATSANALQKYADCAVTVNANAYTVTVNPSPNGTVTASKTTATAGENITLTITPASGYQIQATTVTDVSGYPVSVSNNSFTMPAADVTVTVTFIQIPVSTYTVTVANTPNGTVTASKTTAAAGENITLTITPASGYQVQAITVTDVNNNNIPVSNNSFTMPAANVIVTVTFIESPVQPTTYTVSFFANGGGGVMNPVTVPANTIYTLPACGFTPPARKQFKAWQLGSTEFAPGDTIKVDSNAEFVALWKDDDGGGESGHGGSSGDIVFLGGYNGGGEEWYDGGGYVAPQRAWKVSLAPMVNGSAALGIMTGESTTTDMNVYPTTTIYVFPNANPGFVLDKIIWSLIDGSASYDITEAKNFVMPAMDAVVYVTFKPVG